MNKKSYKNRKKYQKRSFQRGKKRIQKALKTKLF